MNDSNRPLSGRVAIVSGAARNIGRTIALRLASDGAAVVVNAVQDSAAADAVAHEISEAGGGECYGLDELDSRNVVDVVKALGTFGDDAIHQE